jgi:1,4-dihydroxy-2-naphthoate octaprenyltransferase
MTDAADDAPAVADDAPAATDDARAAPEAAGADVSRTEAWLMAARPQTLPAGASPVVVGTGLAVHDGVVAALPALAALVGALLIQVGTNFANDYSDAVRGADSDDREGFTRVTAGGIIPPGRVKRAMWATYGLAVLLGVYLVYVGGPVIVIVGLSSVAAGILYTGGPWPYGYRGLGDLFVFVYFGLVAVTGTYYVQAAAVAAAGGSGAGDLPTTVAGLPALAAPVELVPVAALLAALSPAGLATALLVINNVRDVETDRAAGKRTLAVILGYRASRVEFGALAGLAYAAPVVLTLRPGFGPPVLLPLVTLPLAISVGRTVLTRRDGGALNPALERWGKLLFGHSLLFATGLVAPVVL